MRPLPAPPRSPGPPADRRTSGHDQAPHTDAQERSLDVEEVLDVLLRDLRTSRDGLGSAEAQRRSLQYGTNELQRREDGSWPREVAAQLTQPLALLLWVGAGLEFAIGNSTVAIAVVLVIMINATMALFQEPTGRARGRSAGDAPAAKNDLRAGRTTFILILFVVGLANDISMLNGSGFNVR